MESKIFGGYTVAERGVNWGRVFVVTGTNPTFFDIYQMNRMYGEALISWRAERRLEGKVHIDVLDVSKSVDEKERDILVEQTKNYLGSKPYDCFIRSFNDDYEYPPWSDEEAGVSGFVYYGGYCPAKHYSKQFGIWYDPKTWDHAHDRCLAKFCPEIFCAWFNPKTWNHEYDYSLVLYHAEKFDIWYNRETWNHYFDDYLACYLPEKFDIWFDQKRRCIYENNYLAKFCPDKFKIWFDPNTWKYNNDEYLKKYCQGHKHIWQKYLK